MKKENQMIDALLKEHARNKCADDSDFLKSLEGRLDAEENIISVIEPSVKRRGYGIAAGVAATLVVGAIGVARFTKDAGFGEQIAMNEIPPTISEGLGEGASVALEYTAPTGVKEEIRKQDNQKPKLLSNDVVPDKFASASASRMQTIDWTKTRSEIKPSKSGSQSRESLLGRRMTLEAGEDANIRINKDTHHDFYLNLSRSPKGQSVIGDRYGALTDNAFKSPWKEPLSTFSVDVDTASYTNVRRMIQSGKVVPKDAVRIEEMINYFSYDYPQPEGKHPFSVNVETASCPWNEKHRLVKVGLKGKDIIREKRPATNLVFLLDVSGSMNRQDKLPLLVDSMKILLKELNADDSVSIVVYAGAQGVALDPTYVNDAGRKAILKSLEIMHSGGSTNGGAGITLAYKMAKKHFVKGGVNRVILGTDGDFNVGVTGDESLVSMVEREAKSGVFLSVLGFGQGNLNDSMLEKITNKGNGNYFYIDSLREGRKVFLDDMMGNMVAIAKDVKIQIEFNPSKVSSYRLIGYANRMLKKEDFKNKLIDAGEIGAGHTVTALYEIVPGNAAEAAPEVDELKYQESKPQPKPVGRKVVDSPEMMTVKLAYKQPEATKETESTYFSKAVVDGKKTWQQASEDFKFSSGVALFGMLQRQSEYAGQGNYALVRKLAEHGRGEDEKGHRTEFSDIVRKLK